MTDAELGKLVHGAIDAAGFEDTMRDRVREAVEGAVARSATADDVRVSRAAAERLDGALISHGRDVARARGARRAAGAAEDSERRAAAFRLMAGVRP
jgi:hypothetical protein